MSARRTALVLLVAVAASIFALPALYLRGTAGAALYDGDEAIYAEMAREMVAARRPSELSWDGELLHPRPPASVWALAAAYAVLGDSPPEPPLRLVNAALSGIAVALTILLGAALFSPSIGLLSGGLLATADLFVGYARVYESEPLLICFVLLSLLGWARRDRGYGWIVYGLGLGGALLTKQLVGFLPLVAPIVGSLTADRAKRSRGPWLGLGIAALIALPWHVLMLARHGAAFVDSFLVRSLVGRAGAALLHRTSPAFYLRELFRSEGLVCAPLFLGATLAIAIVGLRRRRAAELTVGAWGLGVLVVYSLASSRYDYYLLLAYPAFALASAWLIGALPLAPSLRVGVGVALFAASAALHLPRNLSRLSGDEETRALLAAARDRVPGAPLYTLAHLPYTARVYADRPVHVFVESARDLAAAEAVHRTGMPAPAILAQPASRAIALCARPSLLLLPRARTDVLEGASGYDELGRGPKLRLLLLP